MQIQLAETKKTNRKVHPVLRIDMTPMVDLGFLLITFFIFTTTMAEKKSTDLIIPKDGPPIFVKESHTLTALLTNDKVFVYEGKFEDALHQNKIIVTNYNEYSGIGKLIRQKQQLLQQTDKEGKDALTFLIKPTSQSSYKNFMDALDEVTINGVEKYAVVNVSEEEKIFLNQK